MAYLSLHPGQERWNGPMKTLETLMNYAFILIGIYVTVAGTYVRPWLNFPSIANIPHVDIHSIYHQFLRSPTCGLII